MLFKLRQIRHYIDEIIYVILAVVLIGDLASGFLHKNGQHGIAFFLEATHSLTLILLVLIVYRALRQKFSTQLELKKENKDLYIETVASLTKLIGSRDHSTGTHSERVREIALALGIYIGLSKEQLQELSIAAMLHDIGKIGIPENILSKQGKLSDQEYKIIQRHPIIGWEALKNIVPLKRVAEYILYHHENFDGTGYPCRLKWDMIPLISRILAIADVFEAITADRVYRKAMTIEQARMVMLEGRATKFDPKLMDAFIKMLHEGKIPVNKNETRKIS